MENRFELFTVLIAKIGRGIKKIKTTEMEEFGLKSVHVNCLYYLHKYKSITAAKLCELTTEDKAGISRSLDFLEKKGLVDGKTDGQKKYNAELQLTETGRIVAERTAEKVDKYLSDLSRGLSEENRKILYESLSLISENIDAVWAEQ